MQRRLSGPAGRPCTLETRPRAHRCAEHRAVVASGGYPRCFQRRGTGQAHAMKCSRRFGQRSIEAAVILGVDSPLRPGHGALGRLRPFRYLDHATVEPRRTISQRREHLVAHGIEYRGDFGSGVACVSHTHAELGLPAGVIVGAVEGIDYPDVRPIDLLVVGKLLGIDSVRRNELVQHVANGAVGRKVGVGHHRAFALPGFPLHTQQLGLEAPQ